MGFITDPEIYVRMFYVGDFDNPYFEQMVGQIYPTELQLNKANSDTEAPFLDLKLSITNGKWHSFF